MQVQVHVQSWRARNAISEAQARRKDRTQGEGEVEGEAHLHVEVRDEALVGAVARVERDHVVRRAHAAQAARRRERAL